MNQLTRMAAFTFTGVVMLFITGCGEDGVEKNSQLKAYYARDVILDTIPYMIQGGVDPSGNLAEEFSDSPPLTALSDEEITIQKQIHALLVEVDDLPASASTEAKEKLEQVVELAEQLPEN